MNPRLRRLESDYNELRRRFDADSRVTVAPVGPYPPDRYQVIFRVPSLSLDAANQPRRTDQTVVMITLPAGYPREKPHAETFDPVFHPNFGAYVCIADFWAPGQSLGDVVVSIGEMLQFRKYNIRSPLNALAAEWANNHAAELPLSAIDIGTPPVDIGIQVSPTAGQQGVTP